jgi:hypothetical protein
LTVLVDETGEVEELEVAAVADTAGTVGLMRAPPESEWITAGPRALTE